MMASADMLQGLWAAVLAVSAALLVLMMLPSILRRHFGAGVAYAAWWLLPVVLIASQLPGLRSDDSAPAISAAEPLLVPLRIVAQPVANTPALASDHALSLLMVWLAGATLMALWLGWQQRAFVRTLGQLRPLRDDMWKAEASHGLPALLGVIRTRIVLPVDFDQRFDDRERQLMLAHERWHRSRGDHVANLCVAIVRCLFWFNPLVHLAAARFRHDQELACDQAVVEAHPNSRRTYGEAMLKTLMADRQAPLGCHWGFSHPLKERVMQLKSPMPRTWVRRCGVSSVALLTMGAGFAVWSAQPVRSPSAPIPARHLQSQIEAGTAVGEEGVYFYTFFEKSGQADNVPGPVVWLKPGKELPIDFSSGDGPDTAEVDGVHLVYRVDKGAHREFTATVKFQEKLDGQVVNGSSRDDAPVRIDVHRDRYSTVDRMVGSGPYRVVVMSRSGPGPCDGDGAYALRSLQQTSTEGLKFNCLPDRSVKRDMPSGLGSATQGASTTRLAKLDAEERVPPAPPAPPVPPAPPAPPPPSPSPPKKAPRAVTAVSFMPVGIMTLFGSRSRPSSEQAC
jgi:bla regulator protein blaR1